MDPESRPTFSQAVVTLKSIDLSSLDYIESNDLIHQNIPESSFKSTKRSSVSDSNRRSIKNWRRHSSCSDPGDAVTENKGDSGIDPGVFFSEQSKKRLSSSCGKLIAKIEEFTSFEELEAYLRSYTGSTTANVEDMVPCSPSEHAKSNRTTSPQFVTPSVCKTNKSHLPDPSTPYAPPPTPCTSKIRPAISLPSLIDTACNETPPQAKLSSNEVINPVVRRRRTDVKANELFSSPSASVLEDASHSSRMSPDLSEQCLGGFNIDNECTPDKSILANFYPKHVTPPSPSITITSFTDSS